jgi:hypothetical protein
MAKLENDVQDVLDQLSVLEPTAADAPTPAAYALTRLRQRIDPGNRDDIFGNHLRRFLAMSRNKYAYTIVLFLFVIGAAFSFPAVRAAASDFLGLFRVQKFAAISISPEQIAVLERAAEQGIMPGEFEIFEQPGELTPVESLSDAAALTGLATVRTLPRFGNPAEIFVAGGGSGRLTIDLEGARAIVSAAGADPTLLSDSLDGAHIDVDIFASVQQGWRDGTVLIQTESPVVDYPEGLEPTVLGEALLQVLGMTADEAHRLAQEIDWTSTLLLPVPQNFATFSEVTIAGESGIALSGVDGSGNAVLWQKDGVVYVLSGPRGSGELVSMANALR